jgi:hypothetical protein
VLVDEAHVIGMVITCPEVVKDKPVQVDALVFRFVFKVVGAGHPEGTVTVASDPEANAAPAVKVKTNWLPVAPGATQFGVTVIVPEPLDAAAMPGATNGAAIAPIISTGRRSRKKRFIVIHLSLGRRRLTESY